MNAPLQTKMLSDAELARLDALLESASPEDSMMLEELDGFFAALVCAPRPVTPADYLPVVLGATAGAPASTDGRAASMLGDAEMKELESLLERHRQAVASQLYEGEGYSPVLGYDEQGNAQGNAWAIGFVRGMAMAPDDWAEFEDDEEFADALDPLLRLVEEVEPDDEEGEVAPISDAERGPLIEAMFEGVMEAYDYFQPARERSLAPPPVKRTQPKVGRNDPCPCGSGKKFKQCCGAEPAHH